MVQRTTVRLPPDLMRLAKRRASEDGVTLTALIEDGLRRVVESPKAQPSLKRPDLPVSRASGGLRPGIDLERLDDLDLEADLAYLARSR